MPTKAIARASALGTAAGDTLFTAFTLPQDVNWIIHGIWCQVVQATMVGGDAIVGNFRLIAPNGDLIPNPSPSRFPFASQPSVLGATADSQVSPLKIWPVNYKAAGGSSIQFAIEQATANIAAPQAIMGILFSDKIPVEKPVTYIERVRGQITSGALTLVGTIQLSGNAKRITGICGVLTQDNVLTAGEELLGFFELTSDSMNMLPSQYPFQAAFSAGLGALIMVPSNTPPQLIPVDIEAKPNAIITVNVDLNTAVTNAAEVEVFIAYE